jgi:hypothetical protein
LSLSLISKYFSCDKYSLAVNFIITLSCVYMCVYLCISKF